MSLIGNIVLSVLIVMVFIVAPILIILSIHSDEESIAKRKEYLDYLYSLPPEVYESVREMEQRTEKRMERMDMERDLLQPFHSSLSSRFDRFDRWDDWDEY